jgi:hypothetical protein
MPYVDPQVGHNPTTGAVIPASWGDDVRTDVNYFATDKPICRLRHTANLALTNGAWTKITFDTETFDPAGMHSTSVNTSRITIPTSEGGVYFFEGGVEITANNTATIIAARLMVNNTTEIVRSGPHSTGNATAALRINLCTYYSVAAADYIEIEVFVNAGSLNSIANSPWSPHLCAEWRHTTP